MSKLFGFGALNGIKDQIDKSGLGRIRKKLRSTPVRGRGSVGICYMDLATERRRPTTMWYDTGDINVDWHRHDHKLNFDRERTQHSRKRQELDYFTPLRLLHELKAKQRKLELMLEQYEQSVGRGERNDKRPHSWRTSPKRHRGSRKRHRRRRRRRYSSSSSTDSDSGMDVWTSASSTSLPTPRAAATLLLRTITTTTDNNKNALMQLPKRSIQNKQQRRKRTHFHNDRKLTLLFQPSHSAQSLHRRFGGRTGTDDDDADSDDE